MIEGWIGRPGSGKTYTLTARALRARDRGKPVFANYPVDGCTLFGPEDLLDLPPGLIIIDEAHLWFPARKAIALPTSWLMKMSQTRKAGWDVIWSTQHENRVDAVIRDVTSWMHYTTAWFKSSAGHPVLFATSCYEPERFRQPKARVSRQLYWFSWRVANSYDTMATIDQATHLLKGDQYRKGA